MPHETFQRLVDNLKQDGATTQDPFVWRLHDDTTRLPVDDADGAPIYEVLSGNHRVMAARAAGFPLIWCIATDQYLPPKQRVALQLSHNAISGMDDPAILKTLYTGIDDVDLQRYTGLDDKTLGLLQEVKVDSLADALLVFQTIQFIFLPDELDKVNAILADAQKAVKGASNAHLLRFAEYDALLDAIEAAAQASGIKNSATGLLLILDIFARHMDDLTEQYLDELGAPVDKRRWVPLASVFGYEGVPADRASRLRQKIKKAMDGGTIKHPTDLLDQLLD